MGTARGAILHPQGVGSFGTEINRFSTLYLVVLVIEHVKIIET